MKYALISDVHSNLPALEAVFADIDARDDVGAVYHLGDLVGYAPWPNEAVALTRERGVPGIAGNYGWTRGYVTPESKKALWEPPFRMDLRPRGGHISRPQVTLVHGAPTLSTLYWTEDRPDSFCTKMAKATGLKEGDLIAFGHTHKPWTREVEGVRFVNTGSVGKPKDGDWRACYVLVEVGEELGPVEHVRVEYDLERAVDGIRRSELPDEFADGLRAGGTPKPVEVP
jgi:predicted phosphodiesterase